MSEPGSGMDSGSDAGAPGDHLTDRPLDSEDLEALSVLLEGGDQIVEPVEDSPAAERAAEDDSVLPAEGGPQDDGLTPEFRDPS